MDDLLARGGATAPGGGPAQRVLIVDDEPRILRFFDLFFKRFRTAGIEITTESDPQRALALVSDNPYALVVSDFRMPGVDGIELLEAARRSNPFGYRVLMTGYSELPATLDRIRKAGLDAYIQKPFNSPALLLMFSDFLGENIRGIPDHRVRAQQLVHTTVREPDLPPA